MGKDKGFNCSFKHTIKNMYNACQFTSVSCRTTKSMLGKGTFNFTQTQTLVTEINAPILQLLCYYLIHYLVHLIDVDLLLSTVRSGIGSIWGPRDDTWLIFHDAQPHFFTWYLNLSDISIASNLPRATGYTTWQVSNRQVVLFMISKQILKGCLGDPLLPVISAPTSQPTQNYADPLWQDNLVFVITPCFHCQTQDEETVATGALWRTLCDALHEISHIHFELKWLLKQNWTSGTTCKLTNKSTYVILCTVSSCPVCH